MKIYLLQHHHLDPMGCFAGSEIVRIQPKKHHHHWAVCSYRSCRSYIRLPPPTRQHKILVLFLHHSDHILKQSGIFCLFPEISKSWKNGDGSSSWWSVGCVKISIVLLYLVPGIIRMDTKSREISPWKDGRSNNWWRLFDGCFFLPYLCGQSWYGQQTNNKLTC